MTRTRLVLPHETGLSRVFCKPQIISYGVLAALTVGLLSVPFYDLRAQESEDRSLEAQSAVALTTTLLKEIKKEQPDKIWGSVTRLVRLGRRHGRAITVKLEKELTSNNAKLRLAVARALCQLNEIEIASPVLCQLIIDAKDSEIRRLAANAIGLSPRLYDDTRTPVMLKKGLDQEKDPRTRISLARTLWRMGKRTVGKDALVSMLRTHPEKSIRDQSALILAEMGFLVPMNEWTGHPDETVKRDVYTTILNLSLEPTENGERAFNLYRNIETSPRGQGKKMAKGMHLLREVLMQIRTSYPDQEGIDLDDLFEHASKGLVDALDPFSQYMNRDEVQETQELLRQGYGGIGAYVGIQRDEFRIISPIYNSPAHLAGLRSLDTILEVDGEKTNGMLEDGGMSRVISKLKGEPGTKVTIKYYRRGFVKPLKVEILRARVPVKSVLHGMLPGRIGYVRLRRFGQRTASELNDAMEDMRAKSGARAIILDLRDNPGGLLRSGVEVADRFLSRNKLIVYSMGREDTAPRKDYYSTGGDQDEDFPLIVLVNSGAASASEIVAGALRDHERGILIGEKTYGKGSVQQIIPLRTTGNQTQLRLTIAKYYLPNGTCVHGKGIQPDIAVSEPPEDDWTLRQVYKLRETNRIEDYVRQHWDQNKKLFMSLAKDDGGQTKRYPNFEALVKSLDAYRISANEIRKEVRRIIRSLAQDEDAKEYAFDLQRDLTLQYGVYEALKKLEVDPVSVESFARFAAKILEKSKHAAVRDTGTTAR